MLKREVVSIDISEDGSAREIYRGINSVNGVLVGVRVLRANWLKVS